VGFYKNTPTATPSPTLTVFVTPAATQTSTPAATATQTPTATATAPADTAAGNLDNIYVYPTAFNRNAGDNNICFYRLTNHAKLAIYDIDGSLVYSDESDNTGGTMCVAITGRPKSSSLSAGIYIYVISNGSDVKKGKIAIIR
jgi:hypothetical protein